MLRNEVLGPGGSVLIADDGDVREVSVPLGIVQPVSNHEFIFDGEADVLDLDVNLSARRLAQKTGGPQVAWRSGANDVLQVGECQPRVDDVFDDDDLASFNGAAEILEHLHLPRRLRAR